MSDSPAESRPLAAATVRSPVASGRIVEVRLPELPDDVLAIDAARIPGRNLLVHEGLAMPFLAAGEVDYAGQPIALLVGPDREALADYVREARVVCEPVDRGPAEPAVVRELLVERGNPDSGFESAERVIEGAYATGFQETMGSMSFSVLAEPEERGMRVTCATGDPFLLRDNLAALLDLAETRVRVLAAPRTCLVPGRLLYPMLLAGHAALAALAAGRPVRLVHTHGESLACAPKRPPCTARYRAALDAEGGLAALEAELEFDVGAFAVFSAGLLERAVLAACGGYRCDDVRVRARLATSPRAPSEAFAGRGEPQAFFGLELHATRIAAETGLAPWEWRRRALTGVAVFPSGMRWGREDPLELLDDVLERSDFRRKWAAFEAERKRRAPVAGGGEGEETPLTIVATAPSAYEPEQRDLRGIGLAVAFHGVGPLGGGGAAERSTIRLLLDHNKKLRISSSQAADREAAAWVATAARLLEIPPEDVILEPVDTDEVPDSGSSIGSRVASVLHDLVAQACRVLRGQRIKRLPPIQVTRSARRPSGPVWSPAAPRGPAYHAICWEATVVEVEVDPITLQPRCRGVWTTLEGDTDSASESTRAFVEGSVLYNLDYLLFDKGRYVEGAWVEAVPGEHPMLGALDAPEVHLKIVDRGKRGFGDLAVVGAAPAGAAAVAQAVGRDILGAPVTAAQLATGLAAALAGGPAEGAGG